MSVTLPLLSPLQCAQIEGSAQGATGCIRDVSFDDVRPRTDPQTHLCGCAAIRRRLGLRCDLCLWCISLKPEHDGHARDGPSLRIEDFNDERVQPASRRPYLIVAGDHPKARGAVFARQGELAAAGHDRGADQNRNESMPDESTHEQTILLRDVM